MRGAGAEINFRCSWMKYLSNVVAMSEVTNSSLNIVDLRIIQV